MNRPGHDLLVVTVLARSADRPAQEVDSPLDLGALDGELLAAYLAAFAVGITTTVVATASLVVRFRRARNVERQQLRWVALGTALVALLAVVHLAALALGADALAPLAGGLNPAILSAAIGAAILRYRLYDLDRIISRTLAYGLLTVLLAGGYALVALGLGQGQGSRAGSGRRPGGIADQVVAGRHGGAVAPLGRVATQGGRAATGTGTHTGPVLTPGSWGGCCETGCGRPGLGSRRSGAGRRWRRRW
jgi:hypothetical protein